VDVEEGGQRRKDKSTAQWLINVSSRIERKGIAMLIGKKGSINDAYLQGEGSQAKGWGYGMVIELKPSRETHLQRV
jgi:hypothetical protein